MPGEAPAAWIAMLTRAGMFSASATSVLNMKCGSPAGLAVITPSTSREVTPASAMAARPASTARSWAVRTRVLEIAASPTPASAIRPYIDCVMVLRLPVR